MRFNIAYSHVMLGFLLTLLLVQTVSTVHAHGGGLPQITNVPLGEYAISIWTNPDPLQTGEIHVTVALAQDQAAALNRDIQLVITPLGNGQRIETDVTHEKSANKFMYEADFDIRRAGDYQFTVTVNEIGQSVSFEVEILPQTDANEQLKWVIIAGATIPMGVGLRWLIRRKDAKDTI